ncbi:hypothetical protein [Mycobacteroides abscessus]|uniref:hypothetical protein n=1 Tax=Mycobacteroides abscessus TaxID=36809 RepID=UPI00092B54D4|nr:hypothetical protein [Mycobacteroides abscessus]DAZ90351.1 TPA_asm: tail assembly chaperone [Mycobacterium phage prophiFSQJ01-1]SII41450.1 Uncharacterised protein [Mycobacteroides abscessus subsp. abscessus]SIK13727.1 Uncharacterised protein [Mycobacteroides abscessus subsp. abscessus]SIN25640.1 Uncharacterised protein [Mycobacteroides abscessus subsp. abscessus]SLI51288.1 Uncharacterised protein [Mycobacteroides abscessus subsp. abscessus]
MTFRITPAFEAVIAFELPLADGATLSFKLPHMNFLGEDLARRMKKNLTDLDAPVPVFDEDGNPILDDDGEQVTEVPRRTVHETTRDSARAMLSAVLDEELCDRLMKLTVGELDQILAHWAMESRKPVGQQGETTDSGDTGVNLGESSASSNS